MEENISQQQSEAVQTPTNNTPNSIWKSKLLLISGGVLLIVLVGFGGFFLGKSFSQPKFLSTSPTPQPSSTPTAQAVIPTPTVTNETSLNLLMAKEALITYFSLLNEKKYSEAVKYHGSGYDYLWDWNPTIDRNNYSQLLKMGCEENGLKCLKIRNILEQQQVSPSEFKFIVQFSENDGTLFKRGSCCGSTEEQQPTETDFEFVVRKKGENYLVVTQPVYVP
jgi:hypothetical protein